MCIDIVVFLLTRQGPEGVGREWRGKIASRGQNMIEAIATFVPKTFLRGWNFV